MKQNFTSPSRDLKVMVEERRGSKTAGDARSALSGETKRATETTWRIYVMAYNRLLRETLGKLLAKRNDLQVVGQSAATVERVQELTQSCADLLLLNSGGDVASDLSIVRMARMHAPGVRIMMLGMNDEPQEFLKCIRGGIAGYVFRDASSQRLLEAGRVGLPRGGVLEGDPCPAPFLFFYRGGEILP